MCMMLCVIIVRLERAVRDLESKTYNVILRKSEVVIKHKERDGRHKEIVSNVGYVLKPE